MTNRKTFLQQSALALAGSCLPFSKLLAREFAKEKIPLTLDNYHPIKCSIDLATAYQYMYKEKTDGSGDIDPTSDIMVSPVGYYSVGGTATNPYCNDVVYDAEGAGPDTSCEVAAPDGCHNYDYNKSNPLTYEGQNLFRYKVYYPKETIHNYTTTPLPAYIFFHAGGFQECTSFEGGQIKQLCIQLSQKGFICFTVEYRRGRIFDSNDPTKFSVQRLFASYRAIQDGCGAIRSFMKKNRSPDPQRFPFIINESQVFIGGQSAGAIIALGCAYYQTSSTLANQAMVNLAFPKAASSLPIGQVLGNLHSDRYYAPADPQYWPKIAGVASMWGGINIPKSYDNNEAGFFALGDVSLIPPLIAFHGANDTTIPFYDRLTDQDIDLSAPPTQPGENYNSESLCTLGNDCPNNIINGNTFSQKSGSGIELKICSSLNLYRVMKDPSVNRFAELYVDCSAKHGLDADCPLCINAGNTNPDKNGNCMPCTPYSSDYGTGAANVADTIIYMAGRIAVHSHAVMKGNATGTPLTFGIVGRSYFKVV